MKPAVGRHNAAQIQRAKEVAAEFGLDMDRRQAEIDALPSKDWKGATVYRLTCHGTRGKGHHDVWVPEPVLWHIGAVHRYRCPYHAADVCRCSTEGQDG